jgi:signal transduction histidine kinase
MDLALLISVLVNILINAFEASDAENEVKVSIDNNEDGFTFSLMKPNPIADICVPQIPYLF